MPQNMPPKLQTFLDYVNQGKSVINASEVRQQLDSLVKQFALPTPNLACVINRTWCVDDHAVPVQIYHPSPQHPLPLLLYFHGGGHLCGSLETHDHFCRYLALATQSVVMAPEYRLSPEYPYPCGLQDCLSVALNSEKILQGMLVDTQKILLAGDSAGGSLALTICRQLQTAHGIKVDKLLLLYPSTDYTLSQPSIQTYAKGYLLETEKIRWYFDQYFPTHISRLSASPLYFEDLHHFPPTYIALAEYDPLYDEGKAMAIRLKQHGVPVQVEHLPGMIHAFVHLEKMLYPQIMRLVKGMADFTKQFT